jgi:hypothetical protein
MAFTGSFEDFSFAEVLQMLNLGRKSGRLTVRRLGQEASVDFLKGEVARARFGQVAGREVVYRLLGWQEGEFEFLRGEEEVAREIEESTESLILEGMKRIDEWQQVEEEMTDLNVVLRLNASVAGERFQELSEEAKVVLRLVDARRDVAGIIRESGLDPTQALLAVTELIASQVVERWSPLPVSANDPVAHVPAELAEERASGIGSISALPVPGAGGMRGRRR